MVKRPSKACCESPVSEKAANGQPTQQPTPVQPTWAFARPHGGIHFMHSIVTLTINPTVDYSVTVDEVQPFSKLRCTQPRRDPGGGGVNVSRVIAELGGSPLTVYCAGGTTGRLLHELLADHGLPGLVIPISGDTREDFSAMERSTGRQYRFVPPGPEMTEAEWMHSLDVVAQLATGCSYLVASGSLCPGVPSDYYARVARIAKKAGVPLMLDTSGEPLTLALQEGAFLVKPNRRELEALVGRPLDSSEAQIDAAADLVHSKAVHVVALTLGRDGAACVWREGREQIKAPEVPVQTTIGAGDSFMAGMTWALASGRPMQEAFRWAVAAGTAAVMSEGTGLARRENIETLHEQLST